jgi:hypothetical protein
MKALNVNSRKKCNLAQKQTAKKEVEYLGPNCVDKFELYQEFARRPTGFSRVVAHCFVRAMMRGLVAFSVAFFIPIACWSALARLCSVARF